MVDIVETVDIVKLAGGKEDQKEDTTEGSFCKYPCHTGRKEYHQETET